MTERFALLPRLQFTPALAFWIGVAIVLLECVGTVWRPFDAAWSVTLFLVAPLMCFPIVLPRLAAEYQTRSARIACRGQFVAAVLLAAAFHAPKGLVAIALGLPWIIICGLLAITGLMRVIRERSWVARRRLVDAGLIYLAIAAFWLLIHFSGVAVPLFEPVIVFLTVVHFHFAGFLLPVFAGWALDKSDRETLRQSILAIGVITGIPMVATGVTLTKMQILLWVEPVAAVWMALFGLATAAAIAKIAGPNVWLNLAWQTMLFTMPLAIAYGLRPLFPDALVLLDIPAMRAFHGTANALGFGLMGAIGFWKIEATASKTIDPSAVDSMSPGEPEGSTDLA